ncbi:hypothetical protein COCNU_10G004200 [Cocos nucifera]|uniref:3-hydroxyisobutyryl-CoA hydrolase n=1 Tax=Cocos nucifera TaxID=13894 RepID=A0A8K0N898_COCNU|nr:hypothetical protein COCNU_10G004200 [Cocos nucifera]
MDGGYLATRQLPRCQPPDQITSLSSDLTPRKRLPLRDRLAGATDAIRRRWQAVAVASEEVEGESEAEEAVAKALDLRGGGIAGIKEGDAGVEVGGEGSMVGANEDRIGEESGGTSEGEGEEINGTGEPGKGNGLPHEAQAAAPPRPAIIHTAPAVLTASGSVRPPNLLPSPPPAPTNPSPPALAPLSPLPDPGKVEDCKDFFRNLYMFIYILGTYLKPHVAILDGITMGGGAGVSVPGTFRIATDKTVKSTCLIFWVTCLLATLPGREGGEGVLGGRGHLVRYVTILPLPQSNNHGRQKSFKIFATPETHIGFHPDAGASFYLSHLTGHVDVVETCTMDRYKISSELHVITREYLALTGERLNGVDMLAVGLATHYSMSARLNWIDERLAKLVTDDPSVIDLSLAQYGDIVYPDKKSIFHRIFDAILNIAFVLESEAARSNQDWCTSALKKLKEASPLSLKVTLRSVSHDFSEGVRARLVDKDLAPKSSIETALADSKCYEQQNPNGGAVVNVGADLVKLVPGQVSTEVDACLGYDSHGIVRKDSS